MNAEVSGDRAPGGGSLPIWGVTGGELAEAMASILPEVDQCAISSGRVPSLSAIQIGASKSQPSTTSTELASGGPVHEILCPERDTQRHDLLDGIVTDLTA